MCCMFCTSCVSTYMFSLHNCILQGSSSLIGMQWVGAGSTLFLHWRSLRHKYALSFLLSQTSAQGTPPHLCITKRAYEISIRVLGIWLKKIRHLNNKLIDSVFSSVTSFCDTEMKIGPTKQSLHLLFCVCAFFFFFIYWYFIFFYVWSKHRLCIWVCRASVVLRCKTQL